MLRDAVIVGLQFALCVYVGSWSRAPAADVVKTQPARACAAHRPQVHASLLPMLNASASVLEQRVVPRAWSSECRSVLQSVANDLREGAVHARAHRHPVAEQHCSFDRISASKEANQWAFRPRSFGYEAKPLATEHATIAFVVHMTNTPSEAQLERLLSRVVRSDHLYFFSVDAAPGAARTAKARALVEALMARLAKQRGYAAGLPWWGVDSSVDVVYTGPGLMRAQVATWRALVAAGVPHWDSVINITPSDYPIKTVEWMSRYLAYHGAISWTESFLQNAHWATGRHLHDVVVECPGEPCGPHPPSAAPSAAVNAARQRAEAHATRRAGRGADGAEATCSGFVFHDAAARKPPLAPSMSFGGSAFSALHRDFVASTVACLAPLLDGGAEREAIDGAEGLATAEAVGDAAYCASVRTFYRYYESTFAAEELFVQTALFNGPFCRDTPNSGGNLRWVAWDAADKEQRQGLENSNDLKAKRPGFVTEQYAARHFFPKRAACDARCVEEYLPLFARKFHAVRYPKAVLAADAAAKRWASQTDWAVVFKEKGAMR